MLTDLKKNADRNDIDPEELRTTASQLLARQFIYFSNQRDRRAYRLVMGNKGYFQNLLDAIDFDLIIEEDLGMAGALPRKRQNSFALKKEETLFLLTLRLIYEEALSSYNVSDGCAKTNSEQLLARYSLATNISERPNLGDLRTTLVKFKNYGLIGGWHEENRVIDFHIWPSIRNVVNNEWLDTLNLFVQSDDLNDVGPDDEIIEDAEENDEETSEEGAL
ncbi:DUF4194 domain-containing protein [uncultured Desulfuromonas sp.]|uniref:DUF4194 domain-containing protein n=1 Tax=uncultured Desulfuromonas sp. TaxID=181013 RepID=UPI002AAAD2B3|nr:DUF4194 domain-containing protein [uncultured Desulfuromonas sp.]